MLNSDIPQGYSMELPTNTTTPEILVERIDLETSMREKMKKRSLEAIFEIAVVDGIKICGIPQTERIKIYFYVRG